jgi:hypothetical protein
MHLVLTLRVLLCASLWLSDWVIEWAREKLRRSLFGQLGLQASSQGGEMSKHTIADARLRGLSGVISTPNDWKVMRCLGVVWAWLERNRPPYHFKCSLIHVECSVSHVECTLSQVECSLSHVEYSVNHAKWSSDYCCRKTRFSQLRFGNGRNGL